MFEWTLEQLESTIVVESRDKKILDYNGLEFDFQLGYNKIDYPRAVELVEKMYKLAPSVSKHDLKRFKSMINTIIFSFGPEFEQKHRRAV